jgi:hypothetical protein
LDIAQEHLATVERLGKSGGRSGLDAPNPHQPLEKVLGKPRLSPLRRKVAQQQLTLSPANRGGERKEYIGRPQVGVKFRDLVFQDEVMTERIPGEIANQAVILVQIVAEVGENQVGLESSLQFLETFLDRYTFVKKETVAKGLHHHGFFSSAAQKSAGAKASFRRALGAGAEDHPIELEVRRLLGKLQDGSAASNFDVIAVGAEAQDPSDLFKLARYHAGFLP